MGSFSDFMDALRGDRPGTVANKVKSGRTGELRQRAREDIGGVTSALRGERPGTAAHKIKNGRTGELRQQARQDFGAFAPPPVVRDQLLNSQLMAPLKGVLDVGRLFGIGSPFASKPAAPPHSMNRDSVSVVKDHLARRDVQAAGPPGIESIIGPRPSVGGGTGGRSAAGDMQAAWDATAAVEQRYRDQLGQLKGMYQFAETAEEKAQLQFILGDIEGQRAAGHTIINDVYGGAIADTQGRADGMREAAAAEGEVVGDLYRDAAQSTVDSIGQVADHYEGGGFGVESAPVTGDATDWAAMMEAAAPREAAAAQAFGGIAADDVAYLASTMGAEQGAQQGELQRVAMQLAGQAQIEHSRAVNERIAQERMQFAQLAAQLGMAGIDARMGMTRDIFGAEQSAAANAADNDSRRQFEWDKRAMDFALENAAGGGVEQMIPSDPLEQTLMVGEMVSNGLVSTVQALVNQGAISPRVAAQFPELEVAERVPQIRPNVRPIR